MSVRISRSVFNSACLFSRANHLAPTRVNLLIRASQSLSHKFGIQNSIAYRPYSSDRSDRPAFCTICPKRLIYGNELPNSQATQKTHLKAIAMLGLGFGLTIYFIQKIKEANELNAPPNYAKKPPRNLVLKGGGQKGIVYPAALKELERQGALKQVKRVAGTSAGAITATLIAVGYTPDELEEIVDKTPMESFLDYPGAGVIDSKTAVGLRIIEKGHVVLSKGKEAVHTTILHGSLAGAQQIFQLAFPIASHITKPLVKFVGDKAASQRQQVLNELTKLPTLCPGEKFREWMEERIRQKTGIKYCTFGELHELAKKDPKKYKQLYVFAVQLNGIDLAKIIRVGTTSEDPELPCQDLIISDAVRCSMSIPSIFKPHMLHYKNASGDRNPYLKLGELIDGGVLYNFPIDAFDDPRRGANRRTLGLGFEIQKTNVEPVQPTIHGFINAYYNFQESLDDMRPHNTNRMILLPTQDVGTIPQALPAMKKKEITEGARKKVEETFAKFRSPSNIAIISGGH